MAVRLHGLILFHTEAEAVYSDSQRQIIIEHIQNQVKQEPDLSNGEHAHWIDNSSWRTLTGVCLLSVTAALENGQQRSLLALTDTISISNAKQPYLLIDVPGFRYMVSRKLGRRLKQ